MHEKTNTHSHTQHHPSHLLCSHTHNLPLLLPAICFTKIVHTAGISLLSHCSSFTHRHTHSPRRTYTNNESWVKAQRGGNNSHTAAHSYKWREADPCVQKQGRKLRRRSPCVLMRHCLSCIRAEYHRCNNNAISICARPR